MLPCYHHRAGASRESQREQIRVRRLVAPLVFLWMGVVLGVPVAAAEPIESTGSLAKRPLLFGSRFRQALAQRVSVSWVNSSTDRLRQHTIRHITRRSQALWRVAIVLDRRIDPSSELEVEANDQPVREVLDSLAQPLGAGTSVVGNTVYIGPATDAHVLRTLVHLRNAELDPDLEGPNTAVRIARLRRAATIRFEDLTSPGEVLEQIARHWKLDIQSADVIPHDLWAGAELTRVTAVEALSLVLIQYGLTFRWTRGGAGIRIVAPRRPVSLVGRYRARGGKVSAATALVRKELPGVRIERAGTGEVGVRGTYEELQVARSLIERGRRPAGSVSRPRYPPLLRRRFTLKVARARTADVMKQLERTGVIFEFDAKALKAAGIRLDQAVSLDVRQVTAAVFFERLFGPLGLSATIDGLTVRLQVKPRVGDC